MVAYRFEDTDWGQRGNPSPPKNDPLGDIRFRQLFEDKDWNRLPRPVRRRFGRRVAAGEALIYRGQVEYNRVNIWGRIINSVLRLVGAPSRKSFKAPNISKAQQASKNILARALG